MDRRLTTGLAGGYPCVLPLFQRAGEVRGGAECCFNNWTPPIWNPYFFNLYPIGTLILIDRGSRSFSKPYVGGGFIRAVVDLKLDGTSRVDGRGILPGPFAVMQI